MSGSGIFDRQGDLLGINCAQEKLKNNPSDPHMGFAYMAVMIPKRYRATNYVAEILTDDNDNAESDEGAVV